MTPPDRERNLQRYFDGELPAAEAAALRAEIESDEALRAKLEGLEHLRTLLRAAFAPEALGVDADALFAVIESKLGEEDQGAEGPVGDEPIASPPEAVPGEPRPRLRVMDGGRPPDEKKGLDRIWVGIIGGTLAAAAAILLIIGIPPDPGPGPEPPRNPVAENVAPEPGSEIEDVDFGYSTGAIFQVEGHEGTQYAVIWISDEKVEYTTEVPDETEERIQ